jgi:hypothetical protein
LGLWPKITFPVQSTRLCEEKRLFESQGQAVCPFHDYISIILEQVLNF